MSIEQMRAAIKKAYPSYTWDRKVDKMADEQVAATYNRLLNAKQL